MQRISILFIGGELGIDAHPHHSRCVAAQCFFPLPAQSQLLHGPVQAICLLCWRSASGLSAKKDEIWPEQLQLVRANWSNDVVQFDSYHNPA